MTREPRALLRAMFDAAVVAALPDKSVPLHLPAPPKGRTIVVGAGKASAAIAPEHVRNRSKRLCAEFHRPGYNLIYILDHQV